VKVVIYGIERKKGMSKVGGGDMEDAG